MPWDMKDYPSSMKNLQKLVRKKAIDIANALLAEGYEDDRAIPIATSQAEKWFKEASPTEKRAFEKEAAPTKQDHHHRRGNPELIEADEEVRHQDQEWIVIADGAEKASDQFKRKTDAVKRGRGIAANKESKLKIYGKNGELQKEIQPRVEE